MFPTFLLYIALVSIMNNCDCSKGIPCDIIVMNLMEILVLVDLHIIFSI